MNIQAEKLKLIEWLSELTDQTILERIKFLKDNQTTKTDWWEHISAEEKCAIDEGVSDAITGNIDLHENVRKKYQKWL